MDTVLLLQQIFEMIIFPLLAILTIYLIKYINTKAEQLKRSTDNELLQKYIGVLNDLIVTCVETTNQTYVDSLKQQGKFDTEAQKKAFEMTYEAVKDTVTNEMRDILSIVYEDLDDYIAKQIEMMVKYHKAAIETRNR